MLTMNFWPEHWNRHFAGIGLENYKEGLSPHLKFMKKLPCKIFSCDKAALRTLSVCPSIHYTFFTTFLSSYHHEIFRSYYQWQKWYPCKRSKVKVTEVKTPFNHFRTVTPVCNDIWWWNDALCLMLLRRGILLFFTVISQISRAHS